VRAGKNTAAGCALGCASMPIAASICAIEVPTSLSPGRRSCVNENCTLNPLA
jgi:hypothetical protein